MVLIKVKTLLKYSGYINTQTQIQSSENELLINNGFFKQFIII